LAGRLTGRVERRAWIGHACGYIVPRKVAFRLIDRAILEHQGCLRDSADRSA
jgi:hypothetical protein